MGTREVRRADQNVAAAEGRLGVVRKIAREFDVELDALRDFSRASQGDRKTGLTLAGGRHLLCFQRFDGCARI